MLSCLEELRDKNLIELLGENPSTERYGVSTTASSRNIVGAIVPLPQPTMEADTQLISKILSIANENNIKIYPISTGNNWGYGDAQPVSTKPSVILDLSKLKKIQTYSLDGLVTIQPGVTQQDLHDYLRKEQSHYMVPVTGAGPNCSIVGNLLERGYGITPHADHFQATTSITAILADGSIYQPPLHALDSTQEKLVDKVFKWGVGPYLEGIFTQGNAGVITNATIKLAPKPEAFSSFYFFVNDDKDFEKATEAVKAILHTYEGNVGSINLMDARRVLSMVAEKPEVTPGKSQVVSDEEINQLRAQYQIAAWTGIGSIYGSKNVVSAVKKDLKKLFRQNNAINRHMFLTPQLIKLAKLMLGILPKFKLVAGLLDQVNAAEKGMEIMLGKPNEVALPLTYWRNSTPPPKQNMDPARDRCGLLWYAPLIPMQKEKMRNFVSLIREVCPKHGIDPLITFTNFDPHGADSTIPLLFNQESQQDVEAAKACYDELFDSGCKQGFVPYRIGIDQQNKIVKETAYWKTVSTIKTALDPKGVIAAGRYDGREIDKN